MFQHLENTLAQSYTIHLLPQMCCNHVWPPPLHPTVAKKTALREASSSISLVGLSSSLSPGYQSQSEESKHFSTYCGFPLDNVNGQLSQCKVTLGYQQSQSYLYARDARMLFITNTSEHLLLSSYGNSRKQELEQSFMCLKFLCLENMITETLMLLTDCRFPEAEHFTAPLWTGKERFQQCHSKEDCGEIVGGQGKLAVFYF